MLEKSGKLTHFVGKSEMSVESTLKNRKTKGMP